MSIGSISLDASHMGRCCNCCGYRRPCLLTDPFVLSWSMLEAMSAGALVIGSRILPVEEVITHGRDGILCDFFNFFDVDGFADAIVDTLAHPDRHQPLRNAGRRTVIERLHAKCLRAGAAGSFRQMPLGSAGATLMGIAALNPSYGTLAQR